MLSSGTLDAPGKMEAEAGSVAAWPYFAFIAPHTFSAFASDPYSLVCSVMHESQSYSAAA